MDTTTTTTEYRVRLGGLDDAESTDYGTWAGETPSVALSACLRDADATRVHTLDLLSTSRGYGRGATTSDGAGNGAEDRSNWWYLVDPEQRVYIFEAREATSE